MASQVKKIKILVCSANLGNQQPDLDSLTAWIPPDGRLKDVLEQQKYPLQSLAQKRKKSQRLLSGDSYTSCMLDMSGRVNASDDDNDNDNDDYDDDDHDHDHDDVEGLWSPMPEPNADSAKNTTEEVPPTKIPVEQFDIVVIGMQEATFKIVAEDSKSKALKILPNAKKAVQELTKSRNHLVKAKRHQERKLQESFKTSLNQYPLRSEFHESPASHQFESLSMSRNLFSGSERTITANDTHVLHDLFQEQLPSYEQAVSYQRGQMRMMMFFNPQNISLDVISVKAQNTGKGGLANKGGIVTEVRVNGTTRIAFFTAHLEAHEGEDKYETRCSTVADIFRGTTSQVTKCRCDASLASHFMFAMGDLNFRTRLPEYEPGSQDHISATHVLVEKKNWETIYKHDELLNALRNKHCFSGFLTPGCAFPPTFKVQRQGGYSYNTKRSPSYTDRILYTAGHRLRGKVKVLAYEPIDDFVSSDHKPIRGAFEVELNPALKWRPTLSQRSIGASKRHILNKKDGIATRISKFGQSFEPPTKAIKADSREHLHLFVSSIHLKINKETFKGSDSIPSPFVCFVSTPAAAIQKDTGKWEKLRRTIKVRASGDTKNLKNATGKKAWPQTRRRKNTFEASWSDGQVHFKVRTHHKDGLPIDLAGAMLHVTVFDGKTSGKLVGTFSLNLASLIIQSREKTTEMKPTEPTETTARRKKSIGALVLDVFKTAGRDSEADERLGGPGGVRSRNDSSRGSRWRRVRRSHFVDASCESEGSQGLNDEDDGLARGHGVTQDDLRKKNSGDGQDKNEEDGLVTKGPSEELRRRSSTFLRGKVLQRIASIGKLSASGRKLTSLEEMNIQSTRFDEPLRKHGVEVGNIRLTIDTWWLSDEAATAKSGQRDNQS